MIEEFQCIADLADPQGRRLWLLSETRLRARFLLNEFSQSSRPFIKVFTVGECFRRLLGILTGGKTASGKPVLGELSTLESFVIIGALLRHEAFPILSQEFANEAGLKTLTTSPLISSLRYLFDSLRLGQTEDQFIRGIIDEFGNTRSDKQRIEEIISLFVTYQSYLTENACFDNVSMLESIAERLDSASLGSLSPLLPEVFVIEQPTHFFPLEMRIWRAVSRHAQVIVLADSELLTAECNWPGERFPLLPPALRIGTAVRKFHDQSSKIQWQALSVLHPAAKEVSHALFDGEQLAQKVSLPVNIVECRERRDEVAYVADILEGALKTGRLRPKDVHIFAPQLRHYAELLRKECSARNISVHIPKGVELTETLSGNFLLQMSRALLRGDPASVREYLLHPLRRSATASPTATDFSFDLSRLTALAESLGFDRYFFVESAWSARLLEAMEKRRAATAHHAETEKPQWYSSALDDIAVLQSEIQQLYDTRIDLLSTPQPAKVLRRLFRLNRRRLREFRLANATLEEIALVASATKKAASCISAVGKILTLAENLRELPQSPNDRFEIVFALLEQQLRSTHCVVTAAENAVTVTELLDARGFTGRYNIALGVTAEEFPRCEDDVGILSDIQTFARRVHSGSDLPQPELEQLSILRHWLMHSQELLLMFPRSSGTQQTNPSTYLVRLRELLQPYQPQYLVHESQKSNELPAPSVLKSTQMLKARNSSVFSEYDSNLSEAVSFEEILRALTLGQEASDRPALRQLKLSVSEIETLADCPTHYFFEKVLALGQSKDFARRLVIESGRVVHRSLEKFFRRHRELAADLEKHFDAACEAMLAVAEEEFQRSELDWNLATLAKQAKARIIDGLDERGDSGRRGLLKGALSYQHRIVRSLPELLEYRFGHGKNSAPALQFEVDGNAVEICGTIDRIDAISEANGASKRAVWDYKTGLPPTFKKVEQGKCLQVPLYALAVRQNLEPHTLPARGGIIKLNDPHLADDVIESLSQGAIGEQLAVRRKGNRLEFSGEAISENITRAKDVTTHLLRDLQQGRFQQKSDSENCEHCEFLRICARDEARIEQKQAGQQEPLRGKSQQVAWKMFSAEAAKENEAQLSEEQLAACDLTQNIALSAGAGSGKTLVLRTRLIKLLLAGEKLESIVAITFTEKAAREIRVRVARAIDLALSRNRFLGSELSAIERCRLVEARSSLGRAPIGTIHSFAKRLLNAAPALSGVDHTRRVLAGAEERALADEALDQFFAALRGSPSSLYQQEQYFNSTLAAELNGRLQHVLKNRLSFTALRAQMRSFVLEPRTLEMVNESLGGDGAQLSPKLLENLRKLLRRSTQELSFTLRAYLEDWQSGIVDLLKEQELPPEVLELYGELQLRAGRFLTALQQFPETASSWRASFESLLQFAEENSAASRMRRKAGSRNFWLELRDYCRDLQSKIALFATDLAREELSLIIARDVVVLSERASEIFRQLKSDRQVVGFDDLIAGAVHIVKGAGDKPSTEHLKILSRFHETFRHIMVDEFQDTDPQQWSLLRALAEPALSNMEQDKNVSPRTLFIVGDRQQSIYSFRGSDVRVFDAAINEILAAGGRALVLADNYRSSREIVDFVNSFFAKLFGLDFNVSGGKKVGSAVQSQAMRVARSDQPSGSGPSVVLFQRSAGFADTERAEAERVLQLIRQIQVDHQAEDRSPPRVGVLTRSVKQLQAIAKVLRVGGVPFSISHSSGFFELEEITQLANLLRALSNPHDNISFVGLLRSPVFAYSDVELFRQYLSLNGDWQLNPAAKLLAKWRSRLGVVSCSALLEQIVGEQSLKLGYECAEMAEEYRNIERFIDALREAEQSDRCGTLEHALTWFERKRQDTQGAPDANALEHPVTLMTVHGAKGLEFPYVILPFLTRIPPRIPEFVVGELNIEDGSGATQQPMALLGAYVEDVEKGFKRGRTFTHHLTFEASEAASASEERRLFYVACTRAQDRLYLLMQSSKNLFSPTESSSAAEPNSEEKSFRSRTPASWLRQLMTIEEYGDGRALTIKGEKSSISARLPITE